MANWPLFMMEIKAFGGTRVASSFSMELIMAAIYTTSMGRHTMGLAAKNIIYVGSYIRATNGRCIRM